MDLDPKPSPVPNPATLDDMALRASALRKNAWRMLPILILGFLFNYIDRTSVGFAALTMNNDLGLTATAFGWGAGVLFIGYCFFEIPSNLALHRYGARRWLARIMISWGLAAAATAFVVGPYSFYAARLLLGIAEAGFFPGAAYLLACWFPAHYRTRVLALLSIAVPLSSVVGGPFSVLLLELNGWGGLTGWQWMFVVQGLPACGLGVLVIFLLRDRPEEAHWLTPAERGALIVMLSEERRDRPAGSLRAAFTDPRVLMLADSGHRDQPIRPIVITCTGDRDHVARLGEGCLAGSMDGIWSSPLTVVPSHFCGAVVKHLNRVRSPAAGRWRRGQRDRDQRSPAGPRRWWCLGSCRAGSWTRRCIRPAA